MKILLMWQKRSTTYAGELYKIWQHIIHQIEQQNDADIIESSFISTL